MQKNNGEMKSKLKSKSTRRPLCDVSNAKIAAKPAICRKMSAEEVKDESLDRLHLIHSDISSLLRKIDDVVNQAVQVTSKEGTKEIKQFSDVLSDIHTSLKPWLPRFKELVSVQSIRTENRPQQRASRTVVCIPEEEDTEVVNVDSPERVLKWESLVSPSPLVQWRAECRTEGGRQLFLLTPMHRKKALSSKFRASSIPATENFKPKGICQAPSLFDSVRNFNEDLPNKKSSKPSPNKVLNINACENFDNFENECDSSENNSSLSPPKFHIMLEPVSEFSRKKNPREYKLTPFPIRAQIASESDDSESSSSSQISSDNLNLKYPELFGIKVAQITRNISNVVEEESNWNISPPITCSIKEPTDEKLVSNLKGRFPLPKTSSLDNELAGNSNICGIVESTPMMKEPESNFRMRGYHAGENTLKKELWTRFEAATTHGALHFNHVAVQKTPLRRLIDDLDDEALDG